MFFQGRQEDAEEYLGFTLNGLHEEMLALKKLISPQEESKHLSPRPVQSVPPNKLRRSLECVAGRLCV